MSEPSRPKSTPSAATNDALAKMARSVEVLLGHARDFRKDVLAGLLVEQQEDSSSAFDLLVESPLLDLTKVLKDPFFNAVDAYLHEERLHRGLCVYFGQNCKPDETRRTELKEMKKVYKDWYEKMTPAKLKLARTLHVTAPSSAKLSALSPQ